MEAAVISRSGDCLRMIGQLDEAASKYNDAIIRFGDLKDPRWVAVSKGQLGTVRLLQRRYDEALELWTEHRRIFTKLNEPREVAVSWHQTGRVHQEAGNYPEAERDYRQSLAITVKRGDRRGQASTLNQLSNLYNAMGRFEEDVVFSRQASDIYSELGDLRMEGVARNNIADTLIKLKRYDEARRELLRAVECKRPYGHAAESWKTWSILENLEKAVGDEAAAAQARAQSKAAYLAYRRDGGYARPGEDEYRGITEADL